jgi:dolichyl-phosphate beta-glucosyltransferase
MARKGLIQHEESFQIEAGEVFMSLVVPAYNEEQRLSGMLEEALDYLQENYAHHGTKSKSSSNGGLQASGSQGDPRRGWEIILVSDGSTDKTVQTALYFAKTHQFNKHAASQGPWKDTMHHGNIPPGSIRVVQLEENRGKGGAVTHGMRHARGSYVVFADADGASKFTDLGKLVVACEKAKDELGRAVAVGSRAHMVGTEAVVQVSYVHIPPTLGYANSITAIFIEEHPYASFPSAHSYSHDSTNCRDQGYSMRLQAFHTTVTTLHRPVYALGRLDL